MLKNIFQKKLGIIYLLAAYPTIPRRTVLMFHRKYIARRGRYHNVFLYPRLRYAHLGLIRDGLFEAADTDIIQTIMTKICPERTKSY